MGFFPEFLAQTFLTFKHHSLIIFSQVVSSSIVDKYIGESARLIREMFNYARDHQPCIIFMDEIDAIGKDAGFLKSEDCFFY